MVSNTDKTGLVAAQNRATPLSPRLRVWRSEGYTTVLTNVGCGVAFAGGRRLYGDTADILRHPNGVKVWLKEVGKPRLYITAMPQYAQAEHRYMQGEQRCVLNDAGAVFSVCADGWEWEMRVVTENGGERRYFRLCNRRPYPREVRFCCALTPAFDGKDICDTLGVCREDECGFLRLAADKAADGLKATGGARLRLCWPLLLSANGVWEGGCTVTATVSTPPPVLSESLLPSEADVLCCRLFGRRAGGAFVQAVGECGPLPTPMRPDKPFVRLMVDTAEDMPRLRAWLQRLTRWQQEGLPTAAAVGVASEWMQDVQALTAAYGRVETAIATKGEEPPFWTLLAFWDETQRHRPSPLAVAFTPWPLYPLRGGNMAYRSDNTLPDGVIRPRSEWLVLRYGGRLWSLRHAKRTPNGYKGRADDLSVTVQVEELPQGRRYRVILRTDKPPAKTVEVALYTEPVLARDTRQSARLLSEWDAQNGRLTVMGAEGNALWIQGAQAFGFTCDRAAFWMGEWQNYRALPLPFPAAAVAVRCKLRPRMRETAVLEWGWYGKGW